MKLRYFFLIGSACLLTTSAASETPLFNGNGNVKITVDFNYLTRSPNRWVSEGVFEDTGTIGNDTTEFFRGYVAKVVDSPQGQNGSFTWELNNIYMPTGGGNNYGERQTRQSWTVIGGTGKYEGMTGHGTSSGTWNAVTGRIHVVAEGKLDCPKC